MGQFKARPCRGAADHGALRGIASSVTGETYTDSRIAFDLGTPGLDPERDICLWEDSGGTVVGYCWLLFQGTEKHIRGRWFCFVPPDHPEVAALSQIILRWACVRAAETHRNKGVPIDLTEMVDHTRLARIEFLEKNGFHVARHFYRMRLDNPGGIAEMPIPSEFHYARCQGEADAGRYVDVFNDAWADHYGFTPIDEDEYIHDIRHDPEYVPELDIVLVDEQDVFAGFAYCNIDESDPTLGFLTALGVRPRHRGLGLGRALLCYGVAALAAYGATRVELGVDSDSPSGAGRLYESVGFKTFTTRKHYRLSEEQILRFAKDADGQS